MNTLLKDRIKETVGTQERLAAMAGIDEAIVSKIVRGLRRPTDEQKEAISHVLATTPDELFDQEKAMLEQAGKELGSVLWRIKKEANKGDGSI